MQIPAISFKGVGISRSISFNNVKSDNDRFVDSLNGKNVVFNFKEIYDLYNFAKEKKRKCGVKNSQ